jgi:hypothetical protein
MMSRRAGAPTCRSGDNAAYLTSMAGPSSVGRLRFTQRQSEKLASLLQAITVKIPNIPHLPCQRKSIVNIERP